MEQLGYSKHALKKLELGNISKADVLAVIANPDQVQPAERGCTKYWDKPPNGRPLRITLDRTVTFVVTVTKTRRRQ